MSGFILKVIFSAVLLISPLIGFAKEINQALADAVQDPTDENVEAYMEELDETFEKAEKFSEKLKEKREKN